MAEKKITQILESIVNKQQNVSDNLDNIIDVLKKKNKNKKNIIEKMIDINDSLNDVKNEYKDCTISIRRLNNNYDTDLIEKFGIGSVTSAVSSAANKVASGVMSGVNAIEDQVNKIANIIKELGSIISKPITDLISQVNNIAKEVSDKMSIIFNIIKDIPNNVGNSVKKVLTPIFGTIIDIVNWIYNFLKDYIKFVVEELPKKIKEGINYVGSLFNYWTLFFSKLFSVPVTTILLIFAMSTILNLYFKSLFGIELNGIIASILALKISFVIMYNYTDKLKPYEVQIRKLSTKYIILLIILFIIFKSSFITIPSLYFDRFIKRKFSNIMN
jgi:phage-related protein